MNGNNTVRYVKFSPWVTWLTLTLLRLGFLCIEPSFPTGRLALLTWNHLERLGDFWRAYSEGDLGEFILKAWRVNTRNRSGHGKFGFSRLPSGANLVPTLLYIAWISGPRESRSDLTHPCWTPAAEVTTNAGATAGELNKSRTTNVENTWP